MKIHNNSRQQTALRAASDAWRYTPTEETCIGRAPVNRAVAGRLEYPLSDLSRAGAKGDGSGRELNGIDLFMPGEHFSSVVQAGQAFVSKAAAHRQEEGWDLTYVQFKYEGAKVEVGSADGPRILEAGNQAWIQLDIDFSRDETVQLLGMALPLMLKEALVRYTSALARSVGIQDVRSILEST